MVQNWRLLATLLSLPILSLTAGEASSSETAYNCQSEKKGVSHKHQAEKCVPEEDAIRSQPVITPQVAPQVVDGVNLFISADFIYWRTNVDGMEYAYGGVTDGTIVPPHTSTAQASAHNPDFKFTPGVKIGLGWQMDHDGWDLGATWTYLANGNKTASATATGTGAGMVAIQPVAYSVGNIRNNLRLERATSDWKQNFNVIDLELGRDFFLSRYLTMRPHMGFKTAWIHETTTNTLFPITPDQDDGEYEVSSAALYNSEHMWGLGIRGGLDTGWHITKNWLFYGDLAFTNLWGKFKKAGITTLSEGITNVTANTVQTYYTVIPVIEAGIGISYINWFCKNRYRFETRLGWEEQVWLDYNRSQDYTRVGNLTLHGLTLKTMFNF